MRSPSAARDHTLTEPPAADPFPRAVPASDTEVPPRAWLERAFDLAFFILQDRAAALHAATRALARLRVTVIAQERRSSYIPRGRRRGVDGVTRAVRTRVAVSELQLLQRLVYVETQLEERAQEEAGVLDDTGLIRRYVKHLVRCAMRRNSFYVSLAMARLLHNYATAEAQDLYAVVLQDPGRVPDDYYYRARKRQLLDELQQRFGDGVRLVVGPRGEQRFETREDPSAAAPTVEACLDRFTPWDSACSLPRDFDARTTEFAGFAFEGSDPDREHPIEVNRIHALLHPPCFRRLTRALHLAAPEERLDIPRFANTFGAAGPPASGGEGDGMLSEEDWQWALGRLRRRADRPPGGVLHVRVDDGPRLRLDLQAGGAVSLGASPLAERVDFESEDGTLLASCLLADAPSVGAVSIHGRTIEIGVEAAEHGELHIEVRAPAALAGVASLAWLDQALRGARSALARGPRARGAHLPLVSGAAVAVLIALAIRPALPPPGPATELAPATPASGLPAAPISEAPPAAPHPPQAPTPADETRSLTRHAPGRPLREIQRVFVREIEPAGALPGLRTILEERLAASGRFTVTRNPAVADAWMETDAARMAVSLVNADGEIVWTTRVERRGLDSDAIARRVIGALQAEVRR